MHVVPERTVTIYHTFEQGPLYRGRLFIHTVVNPYSLITPVTRNSRPFRGPTHRARCDARGFARRSARPATLEFGCVSRLRRRRIVDRCGRRRRRAGVFCQRAHAEFGIRLALGLQRQRLFKDVIAEGAAMATAGIVAGAAFGFVLARVANSYFADVTMPGVLPVVASALVLLTVAMAASMLPARRAARVDVIQALHTE